MVTKKRPIDGLFFEDNTLPRWVRRAFPEAVKGVMDKELLVDQKFVGGSGGESATIGTSGEELESSENGSCLLNFIGLGVQCTRDNPRDRPTMREVILEKMVYGRAYGNIQEQPSLQNLLSANSRVDHPNNSTNESESI
ncbi:hypothetical protein SUGI_0227010 [Cryptomeria japonica]|nr:hypothetical protein SUGI_0227010 [Cryptomeria japonica]